MATAMLPVDQSKPNAPYLKRFKQLREIAQNSWVQRWSTIAEYFAPNKGRYLTTEDIEDDNTTADKYVKVLNATPLFAKRSLASGLIGNLTSPTSKWFQLTIRDDELKDLHSVRKYFYDVREVLLEIFSISNFYGSIHSIYDELGVFGTACMLIEEDFKNVIRCRPFTIGEYYLANGSDLTPQSLFRQYSMTVRQLVEEYGIDKVSERVKQLYERNNAEERIKVIACIQPRVQGDKAVITDNTMPYESVHFEADSVEGKFLRVCGYKEKPFMSPRWDVTATDVYGTGQPGDASLGDAKMLQKEEELKLKGLSKEVDPPVLAPTSMKNKVISQVPGGVTYADNTEPGSQGIRPIADIQINISPIAQDIQNTEYRIKLAFFNDLFQTVLGESKRMTATEVDQRRAESLTLLSPTVNRIQAEVLENSIERTFGIAHRLGLLPEAPPELEGRTLEIEYVSVLAQAQQVVSTQSIEQVLSFAGNLAGIKPEIMDGIDTDEALKQYAKDYGVPPVIMKDKQQIDEMRQARAQQMAQMQQQEQMAQGVESAKLLSETQVGDNNALEELMGA
jgi:hypothetical protein